MKELIGSREPDYFDEAHGIMMFQGDCIEILPTLVEKAKGKCNAIVSDPPYGIAYVSNHRTDKDILGQEIANDKDLMVLDKAVPYLDELLAKDSAAYFFAHPNMVGQNREIFDKYWTYKNLLVWDKGDAGTFGDLEAGYSLNYESIFYYNKGRRKLNGKRPRTILRNDGSTTGRKASEIPFDEYLQIIENLIRELPEERREDILHTFPDDVVRHALSLHHKAQLRKDWSSRNDPVHPTVKPIPLLSTLLKNSTNEGDIVIDPFMGSGTCAAACKALGRRFIGIELRPAFFTIATDRVNKQTLFDKPAPPPVQSFLWTLNDMFNLVRDKAVVPSMRSMQFGGAAVEAHNARLFNCAVRHIDSSTAFSEVFYLLLCGCGVGIELFDRNSKGYGKTLRRCTK